jgi:hypothetical protein
MDAKSSLDILQNSNPLFVQSHTYNVLIHDCRSLLQLFDETLLQHVHREENFCADNLAKARASSLEPFVFLLNPPSFVLSQLLANSCGVTYPRLCND